jgi:hypothetical protein
MRLLRRCQRLPLLPLFLFCFVILYFTVTDFKEIDMDTRGEMDDSNEVAKVYNLSAALAPPMVPVQITFALRQYKFHFEHACHQRSHRLMQAPSPLSRIENHLFKGLLTGPFKLFQSNFTREKGIVMSVGSNHAAMASILIKSLRDVLNCTLPIEIFYRGDADLSSKWRVKLQSLTSDVTFKNILDYVDVRIVDPEGFSMKPFSMLLSSFKQVILVDSDTVFIYSPETIFDLDPDYKRTGALFFKDRTMEALEQVAIHHRL